MENGFEKAKGPANRDKQRAGPERGKHYWGLFPVLIAVPVAMIILFIVFGGKTIQYDQLALGKFTSSVFGSYKGDQIHCRHLADVEECLGPALKRKLPRSILWFGNSQLHGINQFKPGQQPAPTLLARKWRPKKVEVLAFSQPSATLREHYLMLEYLIGRQKFDLVVLPLVFDDTRVISIRQNVARMVGDQETRKRLQKKKSGKAILKSLSASLGGDQNTRKTLQDVTEKAIGDGLEWCCKWLAIRKQARGRLANGLYRTRNSIFRIGPTDHRRRLSTAYRSNMNALAAFAERAEEVGLEMIVYIAPIRYDVALPYNPKEYEEFKVAARNIVTAHGGKFLNLEKLVPPEYWGRKLGTDISGSGEIDFMHFQFGGHVLVTKAIDEAAADVLK